MKPRVHKTARVIAHAHTVHSAKIISKRTCDAGRRAREGINRKDGEFGVLPNYDTKKHTHAQRIIKHSGDAKRRTHAQKITKRSGEAESSLI